MVRLEFRALPDLDGDILTRYDDAVAADIFHRGRSQSLAGAKIELCAVPGTDHASVAHNTLTQRSAIVRAIIVDGMNRSLNVEERYRPASDLNGTRTARRKIPGRCDFVEAHNRFDFLGQSTSGDGELQCVSWAQDRQPGFNGPLDDVGCL